MSGLHFSGAQVLGVVVPAVTLKLPVPDGEEPEVELLGPDGLVRVAARRSKGPGEQKVPAPVLSAPLVAGVAAARARGAAADVLRRRPQIQEIKLI